MTKNENPEMPESNRKFFNNKNHPLLAVTVTRKMLKKLEILYLSTFWLQEQPKLLLSFIASFTLITLGKDG